MTAANASAVVRSHDVGVAAALLMAKWLRFAAAPTFAIMALLTAALDSGASNAFCSATGGLLPGGMAQMYLLMAAFHSVPWLKLISRRRNVARHC